MIINIINDYDGFFESWANSLAKELESRKSTITKITVDSGPYRSAGLTYRLNNNVLALDFYSAVRTGFGSIGCTTVELADELTAIDKEVTEHERRSEFESPYSFTLNGDMAQQFNETYAQDEFEDDGAYANDYL